MECKEFHNASQTVITTLSSSDITEECEFLQHDISVKVTEIVPTGVTVVLCLEEAPVLVGSLFVVGVDASHCPASTQPPKS